MSIKLTKKQVNLLLRFTQAHKNLGMTPALAKVVALLTIVDSEKLSFEEIRVTLGFSKSTTSNAINRLLKMEVICYSYEGVRKKRYFYSNFKQWPNVLIKQKFPLLNNPNLLKKINIMIEDNVSPQNNNYEAFINFVLYLNEEK